MPLLVPTSAGRHDTLNPDVIKKEKTEDRVIRKLLDEHEEHRKREHPDAANQFLSFPLNFDYDIKKLKTIDGFHQQFKPGGTGLEKDWSEATKAAKGEEAGFNTLRKGFSQKPGTLLWDGYDTKNLFKTAADAVRKKYDERKKEHPLVLDINMSEEENSFYQMKTNIDIGIFNNNVEKFVEKILNGKTRVSKPELEAVAVEDIECPFQQLKTSQMKTVKNQLVKNGFYKLNGMGRELMEKDEMIFYLKRYFITLLSRNDEFDHLLVTRMNSLFIQAETKTYPQTGVVEPEGLKREVDKADDQLGKGKCFIQDVILPLAGVTTPWTMASLIFLPNVPSRKELESLKLEPEKLKYLLTAEELKSEEWIQDLQLQSMEAPAKDYEAIVSIFIGSAFVFGTREQRVSHLLQRMGEPNKQLHAFPKRPKGGFKFQDLKKKALAHPVSVLYWNTEEYEILSAEELFLFLLGEYGTGKTLLLLAAARKAAEDPEAQVFFFVANKWDKMLELSLKKQLEDTTVKVMNIHSLMATMKTKSPAVAIEKLCQQQQEHTKICIFLDECPLNKNDEEALKTSGRDSDLLSLLATMRLYCHQAWVVGQTGSLADNTGDVVDNVSLSVDNLRELLKSRTGYHTALLSKRVRNTALIGNSVPADVEKQYGGDGNYYTTATVIPVASTNTLPGYRPAAVITDMGDTR